MKKHNIFKSIFAALILAFASPAEAVNHSTINPGIPAQGSPMSSAPIRSNFQSGYNDINNIYNIIASYGTMAVQNANVVMITGGLIDGVVIGSQNPVTLNATAINYFGSNCGGAILFTQGSTIACSPGFYYDPTEGEFSVISQTDPEDTEFFFLDVGNGQGVTTEYLDASGIGAFTEFLEEVPGSAGMSASTYNGTSASDDWAYVSLYTTGGTSGAEQYLNAGDVVASIDVGTTKPEADMAHLIVTAQVTGNSTSAPAKACFYTTPTGSVTNTTTPGVCQYQSGGMTVGAPSGGDKGINTINATTVYQNGTQVISTPGTGLAASGATLSSNAEQTITFQPGGITAVANTKTAFVKFLKASTVDNIIISAYTLTCGTNPTVTLYECGSSTTCASPTTIGGVQVTATGTATPATVSNSAIAAGDYVAWEISAGACTVADLAGTAQIHSN